MQPEYEAYLELEDADLAGPKRRCTLRGVLGRKNRAFEILLQLLQSSRPSLLELAGQLSAALMQSPRPGSPARLRRKFAGKLPGAAMGIGVHVDGMPFLPTPEETDPRSAELAGPIYESLAHLDGEVTRKELRAAAWRLAGNVHLLAAGKPVPPWEPARQGMEWCMVRAVEVKETITYAGEDGFSLTYFFYSGAPAGLEFTRVFPCGYEARFANALGLGWKVAKLVYPAELVGMTGYLLIEPSREGGRIPIFRQTAVTGWHREHNRQLHEARMDPDRCLYGHKPDRFSACHECPLVYEQPEGGRDLVCALATKRSMNGLDTHASDAAAG